MLRQRLLLLLVLSKKLAKTEISFDQAAKIIIQKSVIVTKSCFIFSLNLMMAVFVLLINLSSVAALHHGLLLAMAFLLYYNYLYNIKLNEKFEYDIK